MTDEYGAALGRVLQAAQETAKELNMQSNKLTSLFEQVEQHLEGIGVSYWYPTPVGEEETRRHEVGYCKVKGLWGLFVRRQQDPEESVRLSKAPRNIRIEAVPLLPLLIAGLVDRAQGYLRGISSAFDDLVSGDPTDDY